MSRFLGREQEFMIKGQPVRLKPLPVSCIDIVMEMSDEEKRGPATLRFLSETLKRSGYSIDDFDMTCLNELSEAVMKVNGIDAGEEDVKAFKKE